VSITNEDLDRLEKALGIIGKALENGKKRGDQIADAFESLQADLARMTAERDRLMKFMREVSQAAADTLNKARKALEGGE